MSKPKGSYLSATSSLCLPPTGDISPTLPEAEKISEIIDVEGNISDHGASSVTYTILSSWNFTTLYQSTSAQLFLVAFISFLCPGTWNALNGLGGAGLIQAKPANMANIALYSTSAIFGFFSGIVTNRLGVRFTLSLGGFGYAVYTSSLFCYKHTTNDGFLLFGGVQLGILSGLFWSAQGLITISYPIQDRKGKAISSFWIIYNLGAVVGSVVALVQNLAGSKGNNVQDSTFIAFIALSTFGSVISLFLHEPRSLHRDDGTSVSLPITPSWKSSAKDLLSMLHTSPYIMGLFPMFFASNFFYPFQFNTFNLANFNIRTRSLNNVMYWLAEIVAATVVGHALDVKMRRGLKAKLALLSLIVLTCGVWGGSLAWQRNGNTFLVGDRMRKKDFVDEKYWCCMLLYISFGFLAAAYQATLYWLISQLTDDTNQIANVAGFYKGVQAAGAAVAYWVNTARIEPTMELVLNWSLLAGSIVIAAPVIVRNIKDWR